MREIKYIVIHCSATKPSMDIDVDWIRQIHVKQNGWSDVGYHYFIKRDGTIQLGRSVSLAGAHVKGYNSNSIGVCYAGGIDENGKPEDNRTQLQIESMSRLVDALEIEFFGAEVLGHRDFPKVAKACPSFNVKKWNDERKNKGYKIGRMAKERGSRDTGCGR